MSTTMENENTLFSDNTLKSKIIRAVHVVSWIIIVSSILIPIVFLKSGVFFRPGAFGFIKRWLSPPYIYLVLNLVIILIVASPRLLHYLLRIFNYFKEANNGHDEAISTRVDDVSKLSPPSSSLVRKTTITTSSDIYFFQDWQDFMHAQTPPSLSPPLERESFDEPWPDINDPVSSSIKTLNSFDGQKKVETRNFEKKIKKRGDIVSPLSLSPNEIKNTLEFNEKNPLKSTWKAIKGRGDTISSPSLIRSKRDAACTIKESNEIVSPLTEENNYTCELNEDETLDATWKAIMEGRETCSPPSTLGSSESERITVPSRLISPKVPRQDSLAAWRELRKSETFTETVSARQRAGLRRDPSLSLDDLNCRIESFIKNFNHQMLLQRQESEQRFSEVINSGGY